MAPAPEYDKEPKAPDKSVTNISTDDSKILNNHVKEQSGNIDLKIATASGGACTEVENNKHIETLDDGQLRALLDEAITYKCPKDREGKSSLFKELLEEVELDELACEEAARGGGGGRQGRRDRRREHHSSLQDLVAAMAGEPAPRRGRAPAAIHVPPSANVSARTHHGGSLPSGVDTSFLLNEEGCSPGSYLATVHVVNPPPLGERRVSASDAHPAAADNELASRRSKPVFPMTYTARATLEIGSGSVGSGRAVTTTTASNQVRTDRFAPFLQANQPPDTPLPPQSTNRMRADSASCQTSLGTAKQSRLFDDVQIKGGGDVSVPCGPRRTEAFIKKANNCYDTLNSYEKADNKYERNNVSDDTNTNTRGEVRRGGNIHINRNMLEKVLSNIDCYSKSNVPNILDALLNDEFVDKFKEEAYAKVGESHRLNYKQRLGTDLNDPSTSTAPEYPRRSLENESNGAIKKIPSAKNNKSKYEKRKGPEKYSKTSILGQRIGKYKRDGKSVADLNQSNIKRYEYNNTNIDLNRNIFLPSTSSENMFSYQRSENKMEQQYKDTENVEVTKKLKALMKISQNNTQPPPENNAWGGSENTGSNNYSNENVFVNADRNMGFLSEMSNRRAAEPETEYIDVLSDNEDDCPNAFSRFVESQKDLFKKIENLTAEENYKVPAIRYSVRELEMEWLSQYRNDVAPPSSDNEYPIADPDNSYVFLTLPKTDPNNSDTNTDESEYKGKNKKKSNNKYPKMENLHKKAIKLLLFSNADKTNKVDSAIPFGCITSPEVVGCSTVATTSQSTTVDPKPRSILSNNLNGLPQTRPVDDYKKSLDENDNAVRGSNSPVPGPSQPKKTRRKKVLKNETVITSHQIDGYQGNKDLKELLRFIESNDDGGRPKFRKHKDDSDDKAAKKRSSERRKDKDAKPKRASSLEELSRTKLEDLTDKPTSREEPGAGRCREQNAPAKPERRSWGDDARALLCRSNAPGALPADWETPLELTDFQTVTKKKKPRKRTDDGERDNENTTDRQRRGRASSPDGRAAAAPHSDRSNDSNDDMDSVNSLPAARPSQPPPPPPPPPPPLPPPPQPPPQQPPHVSYADIARTRHNIPDLIESCNFYSEGESEPGGAGAAAASRNAAHYPALATRRVRDKRPAPTQTRDKRKDPDLVADRRPAVVLFDTPPRAPGMDGVTFGFDINEQLLVGTSRLRCDLLRNAHRTAEVGAPPPPLLLVTLAEPTEAQPDHPTGPTDADQPTGPTEPDQPSCSTEPDEQSGSTEPDKPSCSTEPDQPGCSTEPHQPSCSTEPHHPGCSTDPHQPSGSTEPHQPSGSSEPDQPTGPTEPDQPSCSTEPDQPRSSSEPEKAAGPTEPDQLVGPLEADQPAGTTEPDQPAGATVPDQPAGTTEPDQPVGLTELDTAVGHTEPDQNIGFTEPDQPAGPTAPVRPAGPTAHVRPAGPIAHVRPAGPTAHVRPAGPTAHVRPAGPTAPVRPAGPTAPVRPAGPTAPVRPAGPTAHVRPAGPTAHVRPAGPTAHVRPAGPTAHVRPAGPTSPDWPAVPTSPDWPAVPTLPDWPAVPTAPVRPAVPTAPVRPTGPTAYVRPAGPTAPVRPTGPTAYVRPAGPTSLDWPAVPTVPYRPAGLTAADWPAGPIGSVDPLYPVASLAPPPSSLPDPSALLALPAPTEIPPDPLADMQRLVEFVSNAWDEIMSCGSGKVVYYSE